MAGLVIDVYNPDNTYSGGGARPDVVNQIDQWLADINSGTARTSAVPNWMPGWLGSYSWSAGAGLKVPNWVWLLVILGALLLVTSGRR